MDNHDVKRSSFWAIQNTRKISRWFIALSIFLLAGSNAFAETVEVSNVQNSVEIISSSVNSNVIELTLGNFEQDEVMVAGEAYSTIKLLGEALIEEKGAPDLPRLARSISIPAKSGTSVRVLESEYVDYNIRIAPSKGALLRNVDPATVPFSFGEAYQEDQFYPQELVSLGEPYLLRELRGISVRFSPITYNPVTETVRVYNKLRVEVLFAGEDERNSQDRVNTTYNEHFIPLYNNHFMNVDLDSSRVTERDADGVEMLVISADEFTDEITPFVDHKNSMGLSTVMVTTSVAGSNPDDIKSYIQNYFDTNDSLTYVLLVGDHGQVPSPMYGAGGSDPTYSLVSGSDNYPDIFVGRFSAETGAEVETMVARTILYETGWKGDWFHRGMGIASDQGTGDDGEFDFEHIRNIRTILNGWHYTDIGEFYDGSQGGADAADNPTPTDIAVSVNNGVSIINYTGHGSSTSWATSGFSNTDVNNLTNDDELPFIFSVACVNGNFTNTTSFSEAWLRATNSSTGKPVGAIGFYGSTINQYWSPPMEAQDAFNDMLANETHSSYGALVFSASAAMMDAYGGSDGDQGTDMFLTWTLFGDPSIEAKNIDCFSNLPKPDLKYKGSETYYVDSQKFRRYNLKVNNWSEYPNALFDSAPNMPACGNNTSPSRTRVDIYDRFTNKRIYGFCALNSNNDLTNLWFAVPKGSIDYILGKFVYVVMHDQSCDTQYVSNTVWVNPFFRASETSDSGVDLE